MIKYKNREGKILKISDRWTAKIGDPIIINNEKFIVFRVDDKTEYIDVYVIQEAIK